MEVSRAQEVIRFGLFVLDPAAGQLTRQGANLRLPQQPMQLLAMLLERPGEILTREELRQRLWPSGVFVDFDHGLNKSIQKIRDALGDSAVSPRYIETIPRIGYRFIAPVSGYKLAPGIVEHPAAGAAAHGPSDYLHSGTLANRAALGAARVLRGICKETRSRGRAQNHRSRRGS